MGLQVTGLLERTITLFNAKSGSQSARDNRLAGIIQGAISSLGNKALSVVISFASVPLTLHYLGTETFGAWLVIGSTMSWLTLTDFGLGHGLNNAITTDAAKGNAANIRTNISNYIASVFLLGSILLIVAVILFCYFDFAEFFGVKSAEAVKEVNFATLLAVIFFVLRMPLSAATKVYNAYQEGKTANLWGLGSNILSFLSLLLVVQTRGGLPLLVMATAGITLLVEAAKNLYLFAKQRPELAPSLKDVDFSQIGQIRNAGSQLFLLSLMAMITFQSDNLVIGHFLGSKDIPQYSITYSLFNYATLPQALLFPYLWNAYNEALARGDIDWITRTFRLNVLIGVIGTSLACLLLVIFCRPFIGWWAGMSVRPSINLAVIMAIWVIINSLTNPFACLFAAASHLKNQIVYSSFSTISNVFLSIFLVQRVGVIGVIASTVISYALFVFFPMLIDAKILFGKFGNRELISCV